jgi:hypothetical protein
MSKTTQPAQIVTLEGVAHGPAVERGRLLDFLRYALKEAGFAKSAGRLNQVDNFNPNEQVKALKRARSSVLRRLMDDGGCSSASGCLTRREKKVLRRLAAALRYGMRAIRAFDAACCKLSRALFR